MTVRVPSGAMRPTLQLGQHVSVEVDAYRRSAPQIGDVVLFHGPWDVVTTSPPDGAACVEPRSGPSTNRYIKWIVAGSEEVISIRRGLVVCNGATERGDRLLLDHCEWSPDCELPTPVTVPEGMFYLLGDNRGQSDDCRHWARFLPTGSWDGSTRIGGRSGPFGRNLSPHESGPDVSRRRVDSRTWTSMIEMRRV